MQNAVADQKREVRYDHEQCPTAEAIVCDRSREIALPLVELVGQQRAVYEEDEAQSVLRGIQRFPPAGIHLRLVGPRVMARGLADHQGHAFGTCVILAHAAPPPPGAGLQLGLPVTPLADLEPLTPSARLNPDAVQAMAHRAADHPPQAHVPQPLPHCTLEQRDALKRLRIEPVAYGVRLLLLLAHEPLGPSPAALQGAANRARCGRHGGQAAPKRLRQASDARIRPLSLPDGQRAPQKIVHIPFLIFFEEPLPHLAEHSD
mmetsp:Transcript_53625/g.162886  ORF Transcript_53625/g.162886 Transcript_53625/m.162886 type:complete len:261 (-) Transcript_53625:1885-2667(-)